MHRFNAFSRNDLKNFQVKVTASYSPKHFILKVILTSPGIYPQIYHRTPCRAVLNCKGSNKKRKGRIISKFKCSWGWSHNVAPSLAPSKKGLSLLFSLGKKRIYLDTQLKGEFTNLFWKLLGCSLFPWVIVNFPIVNFTPTNKR